MVASALVPGRFYMTIGHFIAILMLFQSKSDNIAISVGTSSGSDFDSANIALSGALAASLAFIGVELIGLFGGLTLFIAPVCSIEIVLHFAGTVAISLMILDTWVYSAYWPIFAICSVLPFFVEIVTVVCLFYFKVVEW
eukprot:gnl/Spiro4/1569_TR829_c0_g2_i1.p1 gnl/Spiro4/1569_TR829_c0_g2~~gnl/Spiro4/1569_TR829_c0_g2_i1.p1  ORF type:complete len:139 (-),score=15.31 gnl/Spiro4/1569_TR829_c0_g2_i1:124-540(-)